MNNCTSTEGKKLQGKVVIITGGASGIGEATARLLAIHGASVVIADIQDEKGQEVSESIIVEQGVDRCTYMHCDVTEENQVKTMVDNVVQTHGRLDIMFSNAGILGTHEQTLLDLDLNLFDRLMEINVRGTVACVKHAARAMIEKGIKGSIVCTASIMARNGSVRSVDYTISKHAVLGLVRCASVALGKHGIRVNCVSPFLVATPMTCAAFGMEKAELEKVFEGKMTLRNGDVLSAQHVANAVLFLASEDSGFVTGHDLAVDGGFRP